MTTSKIIPTQNPINEEVICPKHRIKRGYMPTPSLSYLTRRIKINKDVYIKFKENEITFHNEFAMFLNDYREYKTNKSPILVWKRINLSYSIHRWSHPKKLTYYHPDIAVENLKYTGQGLADFSSTKKLDVTIWNCYDTTADELNSLTRQITLNLSNLLHLNLEFHNCVKFTSTCIINLWSSIGHDLSNLQGLGLTFGKLEPFTGFYLQILGLKLFPYIRRIKSLKIGFYSCGFMTDAGLKGLVSQIHRFLDKLNTLSLIMHKCQNITDKGLECLESGIVKFPAILQHLTLDFSKSRITNQSFEYIRSMMTCLKGLRCLNLSLYRCKYLSSAGLQILACTKGISPFNQLQKLFLGLAQSKQITQESVAEFCKVVEFVGILEVQWDYNYELNPNDGYLEEDDPDDYDNTCITFEW